MVWVYEDRRNWGVVLAKQKADKTTLAKPESETRSERAIIMAQLS